MQNLVDQKDHDGGTKNRPGIHETLHLMVSSIHCINWMYEITSNLPYVERLTLHLDFCMSNQSGALYAKLFAYMEDT